MDHRPSACNAVRTFLGHCVTGTLFVPWPIHGSAPISGDARLKTILLTIELILLARDRNAKSLLAACIRHSHHSRDLNIKIINDTLSGVLFPAC
jgi:hypothetical protein